ncbi:hypothetical protein P3T76_009043 [Phytophthora citrophthora]|uniref:Uncharacterized protein n=1 Tax=Phytophthora citrophthora TaxID=4793 RepID=A0AAD9GID5_9STRA|nr:hypothetical protein P3T76_009043 [Phytophthora citrophthora]
MLELIPTSYKFAKDKTHIVAMGMFTVGEVGRLNRDSLEPVPSSPSGLASLELIRGSHHGFITPVCFLSCSLGGAPVYCWTPCDSVSAGTRLVGLETAAKRPQAATQTASPSPPLPSSPSLPSAVGSPAASPASVLSAGFSPSPLNTAPSSPLDDASVASDVSGESFLNRLKELHCGPLFGSSSEESEEDDSEGLRVACPPSPTPSASSLFDDGSDEETEPVGGLNRLRRGTDSGDWHPFALPPVPAKHPANGRANHYDPSAPWDYSVPANVEQLHDVRGEYPHRYFLVEWQITSLQLSWVWEEQLAQRFTRRIDQVMQWCKDLRPGTFANYYKKHFVCRGQASPASASAS